MTLEFDRAIIGREFDRTVFDPVSEADIREYMAVTGERDARGGDTGELLAAPTFVVRLRGRHFMPPGLPPEIGRAGLDAGKDIEFGAPIRPGDVLTAISTIHDLYEKTGRTGTMTFLVLRTVVTNQRAEQVAVIDQRMMCR